jgi:hypothetical protein
MMESSVIKTTLKTAAATATIAGLSFIAAGPALANGAPDNTWNNLPATGNTTFVSVYGAGDGGNTCAGVNLATQTPTSCNGNQAYAGNDIDKSFND